MIPVKIWKEKRLQEDRDYAPQDAADVIRSIRRIVQAMDVRSKRVARETGMTIPQIVVLNAVRDFETATTAEISRVANISAATTVTILEKLEARGIVNRRRSTVDRRIVHNELTREGRAMLASAPPLIHRRFFSGMAGLSEGEQQTIIRAFQTVADLLEPDEPQPRGLLDGSEAGLPA
jgi:DNA-binding MarR family transcriptional regulator